MNGTFTFTYSQISIFFAAVRRYGCISPAIYNVTAIFIIIDNFNNSSFLFKL